MNLLVFCIPGVTGLDGSASAVGQGGRVAGDLLLVRVEVVLGRAGGVEVAGDLFLVRVEVDGDVLLLRLRVEVAGDLLLVRRAVGDLLLVPVEVAGDLLLLGEF